MSEIFSGLSLAEKCFPKFESTKSIHVQTTEIVKSHSLHDSNEFRDRSRKRVKHAFINIQERSPPDKKKDFKSAAEIFQDENEKTNGSGLRKIATKKSKFVSPLLNKSCEGKENQGKDGDMSDERLKNVDPNMVTMIRNEVY